MISPIRRCGAKLELTAIILAVAIGGCVWVVGLRTGWRWPVRGYFPGRDRRGRLR